MTAGELAGLLNEEGRIGVRLDVVRMEGWRRSQIWTQTGLRWTPPSPNLRTAHQALLYPATALLEGSNVSVGRGTETPFEVVGAPWVRPERLLTALAEDSLEGVRAEPARFVPTSRPYARQPCRGLRLEVTDPATFHATRTGLALARALFVTHRSQFEPDRLAQLVGDGGVVAALASGEDLQRVTESFQASVEEFERRRARHLLYP
jgi:uncharacterized protein YbbC (DUF1343 family)